jgi:DNA-binding IclR family transcriptional regulator
LEKGLDILQLLAEEPRPLPLGAIVQRLGRSHGELFRMVQVLQFRGFIEQDPETDGFYLTDLLFAMAMRQPRTQSLVEVALPVMRQISGAAGQSCHLAIHSHGDIIIIARMESSEQIGFSVRIGYRKPIAETVSGTVLYAFQPQDIRKSWRKFVLEHSTKEHMRELEERADLVRRRGHETAHSSFVTGVTDISAPIIRGDRAVAALTMPYLKTFSPRMSQKDATAAIVAAAKEISGKLPDGDSRA